MIVSYIDVYYPMSSSGSSNNFNTSTMYHDLSSLPPSLRAMGAMCNQMNGRSCPDRSTYSSPLSASSSMQSSDITSSGYTMVRGCGWSLMNQ